MGQNASNIHIGAARIFVGVTPPATGLPPTLLTHVDGVPTTGTEVGYTRDAATFTYKQNKQEIQAEQSLNPVGVFVTTEEAQIEFTAMEHIYNTLRIAFDNVGMSNTDARALFYGGDGGGLVDVLTHCVALTSRIRTDPTHFEVLCLYNVYNVEGIVMPYQRTTEAMYKITLKALVDGNRVLGDRIFQWYREKPTGGGVSHSASASPSGSASPSSSPSPSVSPS